MGHSDKPVMRYSTSEMAKDVLEVLDHLGWTSERQLHILGVSMGGMIALEIVRSYAPFPSPLLPLS
jgi:pimeloyl-ACP methyl ester carboxylesterase